MSVIIVGMAIAITVYGYASMCDNVGGMVFATRAPVPSIVLRARLPIRQVNGAKG